MSILDKLKLSVPLILAPMSGISSYPYRVLNRRLGCEFAFLEMISARSLSSLSRKTMREMMFTSGDEGPLGIQLLGYDPYYILKALEHINPDIFDVLDFNAGCPNKKVVNKGAGAALLKDPGKLQQILKLMIKNSSIPVTVKTRLGWEKPSSIYDIARCVQDAGVEAICVHGRTKVQGYSGCVDYDAIKKVKKNLDIPVIASGDIFSPQLAKKMFDETGCDAVMIARGALGNPWLFKMTIEYLKNNRLCDGPDLDEIIDVMKIHLDLNTDFYGDKKGIVEFRKFYIWYTRGFSGVKPLRAKVSQIKTKEDMLSLIEEFRVGVGPGPQDLFNEVKQSREN